MTLGLILLAAVPAAELTTLAGKKITGDIASISSQAVVLRTASGDVRTPTPDVLYLDPGGAVAAPAKYWEVELTDGSLLRCAAVAVKGRRIELTLAGGVAAAVPLDAVAWMCRDAHDPAIRQLWPGVLAQRGPRDLVVLRQQDKLDALDGTFGDGTAEGDRVAFTVAANNRQLSARLDRVQGLIFVRKPQATAPPLCKITDASGSVVAAASARVNGVSLQVESVAGLTVTYADLAKLSRLDFSKGKLTYLSDLEPFAVEQSSTEEFIFPVRRDANLYGGPVRMKGIAYARGLAVHSRAILTYDLAGDYDQFRCVLGVDDAVRTENRADVRATVTIDGDGRELYAGEVRSGDDPKPLALAVKGVRKLRLTVASPGLDLGNQVIFADACVSK